MSLLDLFKHKPRTRTGQWTRGTSGNPAGSSRRKALQTAQNGSGRAPEDDRDEDDPDNYATRIRAQAEADALKGDLRAAEFIEKYLNDPQRQPMTIRLVELLLAAKTFRCPSCGTSVNPQPIGQVIPDPSVPDDEPMNMERALKIAAAYKPNGAADHE